MTKTSKTTKILDFSEEDKELYPLQSSAAKYPKHLAVLQNAFWQLQHERPPKDDLLKLLMYFSPKVRLINDQPNERTTFSISAREYAELTGLSIKGAYSALDRVVDALYNHSVIFDSPDRGRVRTRLVTTSAYKDGNFTVSFTHYALYIMYVFNKDNPFTQLQIKSISGLHGHGLRLYPFLSQNEYRFNFDIDLKDLKRALDLSEDSYPEYRDFKSSILKPHIDLINEKTELSVQFKAVKKEGRKASHVNFTVTKKRTVKAETPPEHPLEHPPEQPKKIKAIDIYRAISDPNVLPRFLQFGETSEDLINRIKADIKDDKTQYWLDKLEDLNIEIDA